MKQLIALILVTLSFAATAQHRHHHGHYRHGHHYNDWGWVAPALIGGAIVYSATRPVTPPPPNVVYIPQAQTLPPPPVGFRYEQILDANCNCYRWVLVQG
jgi:hypothetical protein